jgi:quercetin dioxygenase-like cupin family protein
MVDASRAYVCSPGEAELRWMGDTSTAFLATGESTQQAFCLVDEHAPRGMSVPLHRHVQDMESFYVLEGELTIYLGEQAGVPAPAGAFAHVPAGGVHGFRVTSQTARYLILTTPRHGEFYRAITLPSLEGGRPPTDSVLGPEIKAAAQKYGIEFVGPLPEPAR